MRKNDCALKTPSANQYLNTTITLLYDGNLNKHQAKRVQKSSERKKNIENNGQ